MEEFYADNEVLVIDRFENLGIIINNLNFDEDKLNNFQNTINAFKLSFEWDKKKIINEFSKIIPDFKYHDKNKYLDGKM